jgi:pimeloyl-ACP methyl ester carboxylesterase
MVPSSFLIRLDAPALKTELHGLRWQGAAPESEAPVLVGAHGLTRNAWDFHVLAQTLQAQRTVIALDMPGRGGSDALRAPTYYTYPTYVALCIAYLEKAGLRQVDWLGTSMGGLIGMMIAAMRPDLIRSLILNDIGPFLPLAALQRIAEYVGVDQSFSTLAEAERYCRATYADFGIEETADWQRFTLSTIRQKAEGGWHLHYDVRIAGAFAAVKADIDLWPLYEQIKCPVLLLRGERSDLLRREDAVAMTRRGPKAQLVEFEKCGHAPALIDPKQIETVAAFLRQTH